MMCTQVMIYTHSNIEAGGAANLTWFCLSLLNLWIGVKQAGYSIGRELPIFLLIFTIPAGIAAFLWWRSSG